MSEQNKIERCNCSERGRGECTPEANPGKLCVDSLVPADGLGAPVESGREDDARIYPCAGVLEEAAQIVEGELYHLRYRKWPAVPSMGSRGNESEIVRHCDNLAAAIRALASIEPTQLGSIQAKLLRPQKLSGPAVERDKALKEGIESSAPLAMDAAIKWLLGEGPDENGDWFGDSATDKTKQGAYWWRSRFRKMIGQQQYKYDKETRSIQPCATGDSGKSEGAK